MEPLEELKKELDINLVKRCPKCKSLSLVYDKDNSRIHCTKCGFVQDIMK